MAEERKLSMGEVRKTIATALGAAFGFVIALVWSQVVFGGLAVAGVSLSPAGGIVGLAYFIVTAIVLTIIMIVLIIVVGRWASK